MAKLPQLKRLAFIINALRSKADAQYVPADELSDYIQSRMSMSEGGEPEAVSLRTLQRDFKTIDELFGITIKHKPAQGYYIAAHESDSLAGNYEDLLINFELLSAIDGDSMLQKYVLPEHRRATTPVNFPEILEALRQHRTLVFDYTLVRHGNRVVEKRVRPYF